MDAATYIELMKSCRLPDDLTFNEWVNYVFDHPIMMPEWWFQPLETGHHPIGDASSHPATTLAYMTRLFSEPSFLVERFSRAQIDQGLNFLVSNCCSNHMFVLTNESLPWPARRACFDAMIALYAKLMAPVYGNDISYLDQVPKPSDQPNFACYMWWDIIPLYGGMDHPDRDRINDAVLHIFEEVLKLDSEACLESVLHGLGHWGMYMNDRTRPIVEDFLKRADISLELRRYAEYAATGCVQ